MEGLARPVEELKRSGGTSPFGSLMEFAPGYNSWESQCMMFSAN
jgi:hypothetical protein